jgi:hypothetical protein
MERRRRDRNNSSQKDNSIQASVGNEENGYLVPEINKIMINVTKEPSDTHLKTERRNFGRYQQEIHGEDNSLH